MFVVKISYKNKIFSPDSRVACLQGAGKLPTLKSFTDKVTWDNTDKMVRMCANLTEANDQGKLFALGRGGVCLLGKNMTVKYDADDTKNATCNHGIGTGDSMFVYSLGKCCILSITVSFLSHLS